MSETRLRLIAVGAVILFGSICFFVGKKQGRFEEGDSQLKKQIHTSDSTTKSIEPRVDSARKQDAVLDSVHDVIRTRVKVVYDTVTTPGAVYVDSTLAHLILSSDSTIIALKRSLALQDTLIASLRVGMSLRDQRISLLEKAVLPSKTSRFFTATKYLALGAVVGVAIAHR